ncbi:MAG: hypothetical protein HRT57_16560 [Crocinitomicaceae bacterium]|nr:hypothetical protein [Crocinitomicaceae bacterium]
MKFLRFIAPAVLSLALFSCSAEADSSDKDDDKSAKTECTVDCEKKCCADKEKCGEDCKKACCAKEDHVCGDECVDGCTSAHSHDEAHTCTEACADGCTAKDKEA